MDFTFDTITTPGNDDLLATMQAIQNPTWWQNMMTPGFFWPAEEAIQDHMNMIGNRHEYVSELATSCRRTSRLTRLHMNLWAHPSASHSFATIRLMKCLFHPRPSCITLPLSLCVTQAYRAACCGICFVALRWAF
ncbi:hypothetical protein F5148DRAFT_726059 [Russula earlei]|uniref:Uncharacterized protein n=1 Tax=Russula earlei TaxID=71964 RepID=A0ACC0TUC7_9AGAM|nr:hypothetical protein F5148DRAFT_726059 [Russula earlei]